MQPKKNNCQIKKITVIGGGNIGTQFACQCAAKGYDITVLSQHPECYDGTLSIVNSNGNEQYRGKLAAVTSNLPQAIKESDLVFVTYPAFMFEKLSEQMLPYIREGMKIGVIPGTGGAEFAFKKCVEKGAVLFGIQRVPAVARLTKYGRTVCVEGQREQLHLASIPPSESVTLSEFIGSIFKMPCVPLKHYLCITMTPSNPILHTTRLRTLFADYVPGKIYDKNSLFYGEWNDDSSKLLLACDAEHQRILKQLDQLDLSAVKSLAEHYDNSDTTEKMTRKIKSIQSLHNLLSPMKKVAGGYIPDFDSRYFKADFPYGLAIIEEIAEILAVSIPKINETMQWYRKVTGDWNRLELKEYGLKTKDDIYRFYQ